MIVYTLLAATLLIALLSLLLLWRHSSGVLALVLPISLAAFIYLYGAWVFLSVYCKYVFAAVFLILLVAILIRQHDKPTARKSRTILNLSFSFLLLIFCVLYFTGTGGKPYGTINLELPFKSGTYFVFQGGRGLPTNIFHYGGRHTLYAMDIIKLDSSGGRGKHIFSKRLEDYEIYNDTIYSPCNGTIQRAEHSNPDNIPPIRKRGPANLNGVVIETDNAYLFLGHMGHNRVFVHAGDRVVTGQPLGLAGNSGMSIEPHLHIQAHAKTNTGLPFYQEPQLLINFNGKEYLLFESIPSGR